MLKTWEAIPAPKIVIAAGACAINGGPFLDHPEIHNGVDGLIPVDLYIPAARPIPSPSLTDCCGSWTGWKPSSTP